MADAGEIKARVVIEYDGSGIDAAKEDLAKLGELAGGIGGEGGIGDAIAAMGDQFAEGTKGAEGLTEALSENEDALKANEEAISEVNDALDEHQQVAQDAASAQEAFSGQVEETAKQLKEVPPALDDVTKSTQAASTQVAASGDSFDAMSEQVAAFQDIIADPTPHQALQDYLTTNQQSLDEFTKAIGSENAGILVNMAQPPNAAEAYQAFTEQFSQIGGGGIGETDLGIVPETWNDASTAAKAASASIAEANQSMAGVVPTAADADKAVAEFFGKTDDAAAKTGGIFDSVFGENGAFGGIGGSLGEMFGGVMQTFDAIARPLFAMQMLGQMASSFGSYIYNANLAAEGPNASNPSSFTSQVDQLTKGIQNSGNAFAVGYGEGLLPAINAQNNVNAKTGNNTNPFQGVGQFFGGATGAIADIAEMAGGGPVGAITGQEGLMNLWAQMNGQPLPYPGPIQATGHASPYLQAIGLRMQGYDVNAPVPAPTPDIGADWSYFQNMPTTYTGPNEAPITRQDVQNQMNQMNQNPIGRFLSNVLGFGGNENALLGGGTPDNTLGGASLANWTTQTAFPAIGNFFGGIGNFIGGLGQDWHNLGEWMSGGQGQTSTGAPVGFAGGCFVAGTRVQLADGTERTIETLQVGEQVLGSEGTRQFPVTVLACMAFPDKQTYELTFSDGNTLTLTDAHPLHSPLQGWKSLSSESTKRENPGLEVTVLEVGDVISTIHGECRLAAIEERQREHVYNIHVDGSHTFYANGVLVHNKVETAGVGQQISDQVGGIQLPHIDLGGMGGQLAGAFSGIQLPHLDLGNIGSSLGGAFSGIQLPHLDLGSIGSSLGGAFSGIQLPHLDLGSMGSSLAGAFSGIQLPHLDLGNIGASLAGAFSGISLPPIPNFGSMIQGALGGMFSGISLPPIPDVGSMIQGALGGMFSGISLPPIPDIGAMIQGALGGIFSGIQLPSIPDIGGMINGAIGGIFGSVHMPQIPDFGSMINGAISGIFSSIHMPSIPGFASGIEGFSGGLAMVGEAGPELVSLPSGSSVYPLTMGSGVGNSSPISLGGGGGVQTANIIVQLDSQTLISLMGVSLMQTINVSTGKRSW